MSSTWVIILFAALALFGAAALLPALYKLLCRVENTSSGYLRRSLWDTETIRIADRVPMVFLLIGASILSGWAWGVAVSWLIVVFVLGLLILALFNEGFDGINIRQPENGWPYRLTHGLFLIAGLAISIKVVVGLITIVPAAGAAVLFVLIMAFNRYDGILSMSVLLAGLGTCAILSSNLRLSLLGEQWLVHLVLAGLIIASLFSINERQRLKKSISLSGGTGVLVLVFIIVATGVVNTTGLLSFVESATPISARSVDWPALPLICLTLLLPGALSVTSRKQPSGTDFSSITQVLMSREVLIYAASMLTVVAVIVRVSALDNLLPVATSGNMLDNSAPASWYADFPALELMLVELIEQLPGRLTSNSTYMSISSFIVVLSLLLSILSLAVKQMENVLDIMRLATIKGTTKDAVGRVVRAAPPWVLSVGTLFAVLFAPDLGLWVACSASFAILFVLALCRQSIGLSKDQPAARFYLGFTLLITAGLAFQLVYLTVIVGLQKHYLATMIGASIVVLFALQIFPKLKVLIRQFKMVQISALDEFKKL